MVFPLLFLEVHFIHFIPASPFRQWVGDSCLKMKQDDKSFKQKWRDSLKRRDGGISGNPPHFSMNSTFLWEVPHFYLTSVTTYKRMIRVSKTQTHLRRHDLNRAFRERNLSAVVLNRVVCQKSVWGDYVKCGDLGLTLKDFYSVDLGWSLGSAFYLFIFCKYFLNEIKMYLNSINI